MSSIFANRSVLVGLVTAGAGLVGGLLLGRGSTGRPTPQVETSAPSAVAPHVAPSSDAPAVVTEVSTPDAPVVDAPREHAPARFDAPVDSLASNPRAEARLVQFAALQSAHEGLESVDDETHPTNDASASELRVARVNEDQTAPTTSPTAVTQPAPTTTKSGDDAASKPASRPERKVLTAEEREKTRQEALRSAQSRAAAERASAASRAATHTPVTHAPVTRPPVTPQDTETPARPAQPDDASSSGDDDDANDPDDDSVGDGVPQRQPQIVTPRGVVPPHPPGAAPGEAPGTTPGVTPSSSERARPNIKTVGKGRESHIPNRSARIPGRGGVNNTSSTPHTETSPGDGEPVSAPPIPDDGRSEWFAFKDTSWEDVIQHIARRIGKTLLDNGVSVPGELTYENPRRFTKTEALDELNFLLVEQGYFIDENENYVRVFPLNEMQKYLDLRYMFDTYEAFESANLRDMQLASVLFQIKDKPAAAVRDATASAMPDRALPVVVGDTNNIRIVGLAKDVRRFKSLVDVVMDKKMRFDPRTMKIFKTKTNARQIEPMVRDLLNVKQPERRMNPRTRQFETMNDDSDTRIMVDDRTNSLIVKGTPEQLEDIKQMLDELDTLQDIGTFDTTVVEVQHGSASEIANLLNQIFQQERGQRASQAPPRFIPRGQPQQPQAQPPAGQVTPQDIIVEDIYERARKTILLVADDRTNSLIVYANKDGLARVKDMLAVIDKPVPTNYRSFELKHADATLIQPTVDQIAKAAVTGRGAKKQPTVMADAGMNTLHVIAEREDMERIAELIQQLDVEGAETQQRFVELHNLKPSAIANAISGLLGANQSPARPPARRGPIQRGGQAGPGNPLVIPLDEAGLLIVTCTDEDWTKIEATIRQWDDRAVTSRPETRFFTIKAGSPDTIANTLRTVYQNYTHPVFGRQQVFVDVLGDQVVVLAITPVLDEMQNLVKSLDVVTDSSSLVIIPLKMADATAVATVVQQQLLAGGTPRGRGASASQTSVSADALTNSLIVRADKAMLEQIKTFAKDYEDKLGSQTPERRFYNFKFANPAEVANSINALSGPAARPGRAPAAQVRATVAGNQLIVEAPADKFPDIEKIIVAADDPGGKEVIVKTFKQPGQDVDGIARRLTLAFQQKARGGQTATFAADSSAEMIIASVSKDLMPEAEALLTQFASDAEQISQIEKFFEIKNADASYVAEQLKTLLTVKVSLRGREAANRINISVDPRLNRVVLNAPKFVIPMAENLVAEFDQVASGTGTFTTIPLKNADVTVVVNAIKELLAEYFKTKRDLKVVAEPLSNAIIVAGASKQVLDDITTLAKERDSAAAAFKPETRIIELQNNSNPQEVVQQLNERFAPKKAGTRQQIGTEITFGVVGGQHVIVNAPADKLSDILDYVKILDSVPDSDLPVVTIVPKNADPNELATLITNVYGGGKNTANKQAKLVQATVSNSTVIVRAPQKLMQPIQDLVKKIDVDNPNEIQVRMFDLKRMAAEKVGMQVNLFLSTLGSNSKKGSMKPAAFGEPTTNKLIVLAPADKMPFIETLINSIENGLAPPESEPKSYALKNARADQTAPNIEQMLKAKVMETEAGRSAMIQVRVLADMSTNRVFVYAPDEYQELASSLVKMIDQDVDTGEIIHLIRLQQGDVTAVAQSVNNTIQAQSKRTPLNVAVSADVNSNTIVLTGMPKDVAKIEKLVNELESTAENVAELQIFRIENSTPEDVATALKNLLPQSKNPNDAVNVGTDEYTGRLFVTANKRKMRQVEEYIKVIDAPPPVEPDVDIGDGVVINGKELHFVTITRGDPFDISYDVRSHFPDEDKGGPIIDSDWFGQYLKVQCRKGEFPKILKVIRMYESNAKEEPGKVLVLRPKNDISKLQPLLEAQYPGLAISHVSTQVEAPEPMVEELWGEGEAPAKRKEPKFRNVDSVAPYLIDPRWIEGFDFGDPPQTNPVAPSQPVSNSAARPMSQQDDIWRAVAPTRNAAPSPSTSTSSPAAPRGGREGAKLSILPDGRVAISGPKDAVDELKDAIEVIEEDLSVGEVIRIFHFKYGDVTAAARILELMFNESASRNPLQMQQQLMQQQMQMQQAMQQGGAAGAAQARGGRGGRGGGDDEGGRGGGGLTGALRGLLGGGAAGGGKGRNGGGGALAGGDRIRIATDVGHNYLILKCDESRLPEIRQLLKELDIPPGNVDVRVFQLKNTDAREAADNIKEALGITRSRQQQQNRGGGGGGLGGFGFPFGGAFGRGGGNPFGGGGGGILDMLNQQVFTIGGGQEGAAKVDSVEIVANQVTNSLLVSAPIEVMNLVETLITKLEGIEAGTSVVIRDHELQQAELQDVLPLLQDVFAATNQRSGGGGGGRGAATSASSPAMLGPVTVSGDPRANKVIYVCQVKDVDIVEKQIERFDIKGMINEAETVVLEYGDANAIAQVLEQIFVRGTGGGGGGRGGAQAATAGGTEVRIAPEPITNTITIWAPRAQRDLMFEKVAELDKQYRREIREIPVVYADAEKLADKLSQVFGGVNVSVGGGQGGGGRRPGGIGGAQSIANTQGRLVIVGDKSSKKILVRAPDPVFTQMQDLIAAIDQPSEQMQIRTFALKHAEAASVVEGFKAAMTDYITALRATGGSADFDAFTAVPDTRTNSVVVVGTTQTFAFVQQMISAIDAEAGDEQQKQFRIFVLDRTDSGTMADAINSFAAGRSSGGGAASGGGRRPGGIPGAPGGGATGGGPLLDVQAIAEPNSNAVMVFGRPADIDRVDKDVIQQLEGALVDRTSIASIPVVNTLPSQVISFITPLLDQSGQQQSQQRGGGPRGVAGGGPRMATLIANDLGKTVVVKGSANQIAEIRKYVLEFDNKDLVSGQVKVVALNYGQDAEALSRDIERIINDGERNLAQSQNRQAKLVSIGADPYTNSLLVYGEPSQYGLVETLVSQLGSIRSSNPTMRILQLNNMTAADAQSLIEDLQGRRGNSSRSGAFRNTSGGGNRGGFTPGGGNSGGGQGGFTPRPRGNTGGGQPGAQPGGNRPPRGNQGGQPITRPPGRGGGGSGGGFIWTPPAEREVQDALTPRIDDLPPIPIVGVATFAPAFGITLMPMVVDVQEASQNTADDDSDDFADDSMIEDLTDPTDAAAPVWRRTAPTMVDEPQDFDNSEDSIVEEADSVWTRADDDARVALASADEDLGDDQPQTPPPGRRTIREASSQNSKNQDSKSATKPARQTTRPAAKNNPQSAPGATRGNRKPAESHPAARPAAQEADEKPAPARPARGAQPEGQDSGNNRPAPRIEDLSNASQPFGSIEGQLRGDVLVTPMDSHRVIVTGDERDVEFVQQILSMMENSTPQAQIEVFTLEYAKAASLAPLIQQTVEALLQQQSGQVDRADRFSIIAEARSNSLIVSASETNMDLIAEIIAKLDSDTLKPSEFKAVPLQNIKASEAVAILDKALQKINAQREVQESARASVQAIDRSNSVLVIGTPADIAEIEHIIEGIDVDLPTGDSPFVSAEVLVLDLKNAEASKMAEVLNTLIESDKTGAAASGAGGANSAGRSGPLVRKLVLTGPDGTPMPPLDLDRPIRIIPEPGRNSLVIYSTAKNLDSLRQIVGLFDSLPEGADLDVKTFVLKHAQAENVAKIVKDLFAEAQKSSVKRPSEKGDSVREEGALPPSPPGLAGRGLPYYVTINHDVRTNTVFVIGRKESVLLAAGLIQQLDTAGTDLALRSHVISGLKNMNVADLETKLRDILDKRAQALGEKNDARDNAFLMADERSNSMVVFASDDMYKLISDLAMQLDSSASYRIVGLEFRHLKAADSARLAAMLQEVFDKRKQADTDVTKNGQKEVLNIVADSRSNSVMLVGTRDYLAEAQNLITNLDQSFDPTLEFKVRPLLLASASNLATLLKDMVEKSRSNQDPAAAKATPIHIAADGYSNSLLIAASHDDMQQVQRWVDLLDKKPEYGKVTRLIPLKRGSAEQVSKTASDLYAKTAGQGAASDVVVTFDKTTNSVIAVGPSAVVADIEALVDQMGSATVASSQLLRTFRLEKADAAAAGALLRNVLSGQGGQVNASGQATGSSGGGGSNSGTSAAERAAEQIMLVYQQKNDLGTSTFQAMRQQIVITDDLRTNSLFVTAPAESMPLVESLISVIDVPPTALTVRIYPLRSTDKTEDIVTKLRDLFPRSSGSSGGSSGSTGSTQGQIALGDGAAGGRQEVAFTSDSRTNSVIAAGTPGYLDIVDNLLIKLDSRDVTDRVTKVFAPINNKAQDIQTMLSDFADKEKAVLDGVQNVSPNRKMEQEITAVSSEEINRVIVGSSSRREAEVLELLRELDQPPPQVMIKVLILEVTMDNDLELGVEFAFQDLQFASAGPNDTNTFDYVGGTDIGAVGAGLGGFTFTITGRDFNFLFRTLQSQGALNVLSRPQIVAMDNQEAKIEITNDVPYVSGTSTSDAGQITTTVQRQDIGIKLDVTPQINPDGFVRMKVTQEVSDFADTSVPVGPGLTAPVFFKRVADTTVTVKDNETVVIGGLITARDEVRETKIPVLGDIPGVGLLFSNRTHSNRRTELLVIMTPTILRTVEDYRDASLTERDRAKTISPDTLGSDLMEGLQLKPEEVNDRKTKVEMGPIPDEVLRALSQKEAEKNGKPAENPANGKPQPTPPDAQPEPGPDEYGPQRPGRNAAPSAPSADGYEIRDPRVGKAASPAQTVSQVARQ